MRPLSEKIKRVMAERSFHKLQQPWGFTFPKP
jgi:hypothetical protein